MSPIVHIVNVRSGESESLANITVWSCSCFNFNRSYHLLKLYYTIEYKYIMPPCRLCHWAIFLGQASSLILAFHLALLYASIVIFSYSLEFSNWEQRMKNKSKLFRILQWITKRFIRLKILKQFKCTDRIYWQCDCVGEMHLVHGGMQYLTQSIRESTRL